MAAADARSIGDRYVLEIMYTQQYQELPLTATDAASEGWTVSDDCIPGFGRRAHADGYLKLWEDGRDGDLHLWYDKSGSIIGFGVSSKSGVAEPWRRVDDHYEIDFLTRDPEQACKETPSAKAGSVGDRLVMAGDNDFTAIPLTLQGAIDEKYNDGGPCFPDMGHHMMLNRWEVSSPTPVYGGDGGILAMNLNSFVEQQTPSFEYPQPKEGKAVYGWHVYFKEHVNACEGAPTAYPLPFAETPEESVNTDFKCTPYFGTLWIETLTTVVDLHASGHVCKDAGQKGDCTFVHYMGPNKKQGYGTTCVPPQQSDRCHCYHQVTYSEGCNDQLSSSTDSGSVDNSDRFDDNGVLKSCANDVVSMDVVGWGPGPDGLEPCACDGVAEIQV
jgi:hypothetical protein